MAKINFQVVNQTNDEFNILLKVTIGFVIIMNKRLLVILFCIFYNITNFNFNRIQFKNN